MNTLLVNTLPTPDLNISTLAIDYQDFDPHLGITFICTFLNSSSKIIDKKSVIMDGTTWQNWGPSDDPQTDYDYVIDFCLNALELTKKPDQE